MNIWKKALKIKKFKNLKMKIGANALKQVMSWQTILLVFLYMQLFIILKQPIHISVKVFPNLQNWLIISYHIII